MSKYKKRIDIGNYNLRELIREDSYFVDKTLIIKDVIEASKVTLIPRPRRFGKTLNMSILKHFFDLNEKEANINLFDGLKIMDAGEKYTKHQFEYPVISLSLKNLDGKTWKSAYSKILDYLSKVFMKYDYVLNCLKPIEKKNFSNIINKKAKQDDLENSLDFLIQCLYKYHKKPVVLLIDEYDSPIIGGYDSGYYNEIIGFMRQWFGTGLKNNESESIYRAVITGILRVSRESIFSDLNNLEVDSVLDNTPFADKFGFTENEVQGMLEYYEKIDSFPAVKKWYDGYNYGNNTIYNPWSVTNFVKSNAAFPKSYWKNTSSNSLVHEELLTGDEKLREQLEKLIQGEKLICPINENIVFKDIGKGDAVNIWSFLFYAGYLKTENPRPNPAKPNQVLYETSLPNIEVESVYEDFIERFFQGDRLYSGLQKFLECFTENKYERLEECLQELVLGLVSFHDANKKMPEVVFHAFVLGLLANLKDAYEIRSNAEAGYGRADVSLRPKIDILKTAFVIEFKAVKNGRFTTQLTNAMKQIKKNEYHTALINAGVAKKDIVEIAIVLKGKKIKVKINNVNGEIKNV